MATRSVDDAFNVLCRRLTPGKTEKGKAQSHYRSIRARLEKYYDLKTLTYSGSAENATSIRGYSDIDMFARIPRENLKQDSSVSLRKIKECLQERYPTTNVYVDTPAIVLDFGGGDWDTVEVIPADYLSTENGYNIYDIPAPGGEWLNSSPMAHKSYIAQNNTKLGLKLKPLIRLIKAWKYYQSVPISSFYIELRTTKYMENENSIVYQIDVNTILTKLFDAQLSSMQDPKGISGYVKAAKTDTMKSNALSKLKTAVSRSQKAREAEHLGKTDEAFYYWNLLFNGNFPPRYY